MGKTSGQVIHKMSRRHGSPQGRPVRQRSAPSANNTFPIVGIGASAGGYEALRQLLEHLSSDANMTLVIVQHLDPTHPSKLAELLGKATSLPIHEVNSHTAIEPRHIYVIPPNTQMGIFKGKLKLTPRSESEDRHAPIDFFLSTLARDAGHRAVGVILSGIASDGSLGVKEIKAAGGITFAQDDKSARYSGMPTNAVKTGCIDYVLPPDAIARELMRIADHPYLNGDGDKAIEQQSDDDEGAYKAICSALRAESGVDFAKYKQPTLKRRIARRMVVKKMDSLEDYAHHLRTNPDEVRELFRDALIHLTGFFRDPACFQALRKKVLPKILQQLPPDVPVRVWVPGCSTGEEAYSIAICLQEALAPSKRKTPLAQVFATDISEEAIVKARAGVYSEHAVKGVSPERLARFFNKLDGGYQVHKNIRDLCLFAKQNVTEDPPFSRLDLISCRNLMIYLGEDLQRRIIPIFQYALKPGGFLVLGSSESLSRFAETFTLVDRKNKIHVNRQTNNRPRVDFRMSSRPEEPVKAAIPPPRHADATSQAEVDRHADYVLLSKYSPAGVVINSQMDILSFRGHTGLFLEPPPGHPTSNVVQMARSGLGVEIRSALHKAIKEDAPVKMPKRSIKTNGETQDVAVEVVPFRIASSEERLFLVLFHTGESGASGEPSHGSSRKKSGKGKAPATRRVEELERELKVTKDSMQGIIEDLEATNEELTAANEEVQSTNEELQTTVEELETAKEELQSSNEELMTLSDEQQTRNNELNIAHGDLSNVFNSVNIPMLILNPDLTIRRFTPQAARLFNLIPTDHGRLITDLRPQLKLPDWSREVSEVMESLVSKEIEVTDLQGHWYSLRIRPYRAVDDKIGGAVIAVVDIDDYKRTLTQMLELVRNPMLVLGSDLRVVHATGGFYATFQVKEPETIGSFLYDLGNGQWNIPEMRKLLEEVLPQKKKVENYTVEHEFESIGRRKMTVSARSLDLVRKETQWILLSIEDVTKA